MNRFIAVMLVAMLMHSTASVASVVSGDFKVNNLVALSNGVAYPKSRTGMNMRNIYVDFYQFTVSSLTPIIKTLDISRNNVSNLSFRLYYFDKVKSSGAPKDFKLTDASKLKIVPGCGAFTAATDCSVDKFAGSYVLKVFASGSSHRHSSTCGHSGSYGFTLSAVPLPPAAILFGSVLFGLAVVGRRRSLGKRSAE